VWWVLEGRGIICEGLVGWADCCEVVRRRERKGVQSHLLMRKATIKWLNISNQEAKSQPRFTPAIGSHNFWHKGTNFQLRRKEVAMFHELGGGPLRLKTKN